MIKVVFIFITLIVSLSITGYVVINSIKGLERIKRIEREFYYYEDDM